MLEHLRARIAEPLEPPRDWRHENPVSCGCSYCSDLGRFLKEPERGTWKLKAAQAKRSHVELTIRRDACDLDYKTDRRGSPHTLVCTKNQAGYQRRVEQRAQDLGALERLETPADS